MSYLSFYHLKKEPFNVTPDPEFLFLSPSHKEALGAFIYGITKRKGIVAIIGEVGMGKTTVLRAYLEGVNPEVLKTIYLFNSNLFFADLIRSLADELGIQAKSDSVFETVNHIQRALIEEYKKGKNVVLIVDEAQNMPVETLENLRMLSNLETSKDKLIQIALIGQPELEEKFNRHELRQLKQRIAVKATILPLTPQESREYVHHRLAKCRTKTDVIFSNAALNEILKEARGTPRLINILCDNALITGFGYQQKPIGSKVVREVIADFKGERQRPSYKWVAACAAAVILFALLLWAFAFRSSSVERTSLDKGKTQTAISAQEKEVEKAKPSARLKTAASHSNMAPAAKSLHQNVVESNEKTPPAVATQQKEIAQKSEPAKTDTSVPATKTAQSPKQPAESEPPVIAQTDKPLMTVTPSGATTLPTKSAASKTKTAQMKTVTPKPSAPLAARTKPASKDSKIASANIAAKANPSMASSLRKWNPPATYPYQQSPETKSGNGAKTTRIENKPLADASGTPPAVASSGELPKEIPSERLDQPQNTDTAQETKDVEATVPSDEAGAGSNGTATTKPATVEAKPPSLDQSTTKTNENIAETSEEVPLSTEVTRPEVIQSVTPHYPRRAQIRRIQGTVVVSVLVSKSGDVQAVRVIKGVEGDDSLENAAVSAAKQWKFHPAVKDGKRVSVWMSFPVVFRLNRNNY